MDPEVEFAPLVQNCRMVFLSRSGGQTSEFKQLHALQGTR